jgi:hypothetical protein
MRMNFILLTSNQVAETGVFQTSLFPVLFAACCAACRSTRQNAAPWPAAEKASRYTASCGSPPCGGAAGIGQGNYLCECSVADFALQYYGILINAVDTILADHVTGLYNGLPVGAVQQCPRTIACQDPCYAPVGHFLNFSSTLRFRQYGFVGGNSPVSY